MRGTLLAVLLLAACGRSGSELGATEAVAQNLVDQSCTLCAMLVSEQPAPRAQLLYRGGERRFFCSISELVSFLGVPSPLGKPLALFVESLDPNAEPSSVEVTMEGWVPVDQAFFVVGGPSRRVMGESILVYAAAAAAQEVSRKVQGSVLTWEQLQNHLSK